MTWVAGIDEAGRGPVLGSMIVCAFAAKKEDETLLKKMGVKDSKMLTAARRKELFPEILKIGKAAVIEDTAKQLNEEMKRLSLNDIEALKMAAALVDLEAQVKLDTIYIDSPDPVLSTFERRIRRYYKGPAKIVCAHKADQKYPVVSAASVVAKVTRDAGIDKLKKQFGEDIGTGYSHDERTISFLKRHWGNKSHPVHEHIRTHWATAKNLSITQFKLDGYL